MQRPSLSKAFVLLFSILSSHGCSRGVTVTESHSKDTAHTTAATTMDERSLFYYINDGNPQKGLPVVDLVFETTRGGIHIKAEVASTMAQRAKGLMYRTRLGEHEGMLFVFEKEQPLSFWMKNTFIPLDMIFLDATKRVVGVVEGAQPLDESPRGVGRPSMYVIEVPAGFVHKYGITRGTRVHWQRTNQP